ncbi:twin-arginine translocation signal domain-containing protein [Candidatus Pacearchaeota archaeon]|nr:twin-arginine translocation signal domain-containing protein [Candidatus Pacearchaeota archaeon]
MNRRAFLKMLGAGVAAGMIPVSKGICATEVRRQEGH